MDTPFGRPSRSGPLGSGPQTRFRHGFSGEGPLGWHDGVRTQRRERVPLSRPALSLGTGPRGVQDARRWVVDTCRDIGRDDLVECAELGVSELVTNALLHATGPITVR